MTRPPDPPRDPAQDQDNLVQLPLTDEPSPEPGARLAQEPAALSAWLQHAEDPALTERLAELAQELAEGPRPLARPQRRWLPIAAAALLLLGAATIHLWPQREPSAPAEPLAQTPAPAPIVPAPSPPPEPAIATPEPAPSPRPKPRQQRFESNDPDRIIALVEGVGVQLDGELELRGSDRAPRLRLRGSAVIDVVPGSVESLVVDSDAAVVRVLGTRFSVREQAQQTSVAVERGKVAVRCATGEQATILPGDQHACPNANGLLIQAELARRQGQPAAEVLALVEAGMGFEGFALRERLELMRMELLLELQRLDQAREAIQAYLARERVAYRDEAERLAERLTPAP
jgi:ferric-dicitrate binding protein FerR (iron transport regulator)